MFLVIETGYLLEYQAYLDNETDTQLIRLVIITGILELSVWGLITLSLIVGVISIEKAVNKAAIGVSNKKLVHCHIVSFIIWLLFYIVEQAFFFWKIIVK